jgi:hypothetical protein
VNRGKQAAQRLGRDTHDADDDPDLAQVRWARPTLADERAFRGRSARSCSGPASSSVIRRMLTEWPTPARA